MKARYFTVLLTIMVISAVHASEEVGVWHFDDTDPTMAVDSSPNGYNGIVTGTAIVEGKTGNAREFDGMSYIVIPIDQNPNSINNIKIELWEKTSSSNTVIIFWREKGSPPYRSGFTLSIDEFGMPVITAADGASIITLTGPNPINDNEWHKITSIITREKITIEVDGSVQSVQNNIGIIENNDYIYIGSEKGDVKGFVGTMDEVSITRINPEDLSFVINQLGERVGILETRVSETETNIVSLHSVIDSAIKKFNDLFKQVFGFFGGEPKNEREKMVCNYMKESRLTSYSALGLKCTIDKKKDCDCREDRK